MPVYSTHPQYDEYVERWELVRNVVNSKVKQYIYNVAPDTSDNIMRNKRYKDSAQFTNFTGRTRNALVGQVFRKEMVIELPPSIEYIKDDATGQDMSLQRLAQDVTGEVLMSGRYGLLVDYPAANEGLTALEVERYNLKARIYKYNAESIINWQTTSIGGDQVLSLVVLKEDVCFVGEDGYQWQSKTQYRVLTMYDGYYVQVLYKDKEDDDPAIFEPKNARGERLTYIPFIFVGSEDNDAEIDPAPLYDIAMLNIGHLRNSADYEEMVYVTGQPSLFITTDISYEQFKEQNPQGILLGATRGYNLGQSGSAQLVQAQPTNLPDEAMKRKEEQIVMIGGRLSGQAAPNETAEAARGRHSGEVSALMIIRNNVNHALEKACEYVLDFMGSENERDQIELSINEDFFEKTLDPQKIIAKLQLYTAGIIAKTDIRDELRRYNEINPGRTDDEIDAEVANEVDLFNPLAA